MDKAMVSRVQSEALQMMVNDYINETVHFKGVSREEAISIHIENLLKTTAQNMWRRQLEPLNGLTGDQMIRAVYVGWEVKDTPLRQIYKAMHDRNLTPSTKCQLVRAIIDEVDFDDMDK